MEVNYPAPQEAPETIPFTKPLFNRFLESGREGRNEWWRYTLGILLTFIVGYQMFGIVPLVIIVISGVVSQEFTLNEFLANPANLQNHEFLHVSKNTLLAAILFIFVAALVFLVIAIRYIHRKRIMSVIASDRRPFSFNRYFSGFGVWLAFNILQLVISLAVNPDNFHVVFEPIPFIGSLVICLFLLPIQTGWEEIFVRGYLIQSIGLKTKTGLWPWIITSVLFGLLHIMNAEVQHNGIAMMLPQYIFPGLVFGAIVLMDERLELAMGMHFANNLFGALTISNSDSTLQANTIWSVDSIVSTPDIVMSYVMQLAVVVLLYKVYKWDIKKLYK